MATEKLIIELDAKTQKLDRELKSVDNRLNQIEGSTNKADKGFAAFSGTALKFGGIAMQAATAVIAVKAAVDAMILSSAKSRMELEQLSRQAKLSTTEFQALTFAAKQYGVTGEQIADISKDVADRLGEFATAGTGTFQDFLDVMGMTKAQGVKLAKEFQNMSSDQVIGEMVRRMEEAGATGNQMTFVLESMGNDLSKLAPLFADNASELKSLTGAYKSANSELEITQLQAEKLKDVSTSFDLMTSGIGNATTAISATLAPSLNEFFKSVTEIVPVATQVFIDFINTFIDAGNITSMDQINKQMKLAEDTITRTQWAQDALNEKKILDVRTMELQVKQLAEREEAEARLIALQQQKLELENEQQKLDDAKKPGSGKISGDGTGGSAGGSADDNEKKIQEIADRFKAEEQLLKEKLDKELAIVGENEELRNQLQLEYDEALKTAKMEKEAEFRQAESDMYWEMIEERNQERFDAEIAAQQELLNAKLINEEDYLKQVNKIGQKYAKLELKQKKKDDKTKDAMTWDTAHSAIDAAGAVFSNNKAVSSTLAFINTAEGVTAALAKYDYVGAAITAATGAVQIAAINSAEPGTGGGGVSAPSQPSAPVNDSRVSSSVEINESITSGSNQQNVSREVTFTSNSSDAISNAVVEYINAGIRSGDIVLGG